MSGVLIALRSMATVIYGSAAVVFLVMASQFFAVDIVKHVSAFGLKLSKVSRTGV